MKPYKKRVLNDVIYIASNGISSKIRTDVTGLVFNNIKQTPKLIKINFETLKLFGIK